MIAALRYNETRRATEAGDRVVVEEYEYYSKAKGRMRKKMKMGPVVLEWKRILVEKIFNQFANHENSVDERNDSDSERFEDEEEREIEFMNQRLDELLVFDEDDVGEGVEDEE